MCDQIVFTSQTSTIFPLLKLPYLSLKCTVEHMEVMEIYNLSMTSRVSRDILKFMKLKIEGMSVFANSTFGRVNFFGLSPTQHFKSTEENKDNLEGDTKEKNLVSNYLDRCLEMAIRMSQLFVMNKCGYEFVRLKKSPEEMLHILSKILAEKCTSLSIKEMFFVKGQGFVLHDIDKRVLDYLLDHLDRKAELALTSRFPENYRHENFFKFQSIFLNNAWWVTVEDLKSLRNGGSYSFFNTSFHTESVLDILQYFINCEEDMADCVTISVKKENNIVKDEILDRLTTVTLMQEGNRPPAYLIKVRNHENRKHVLVKLEIWVSGLGIHLETVKDNKQYILQLKLLELMEVEKDLGEELREIDEHEKRAEDDPSNVGETLKNLAEKRVAIQLGLADIQMKLLVMQ